MGDIVPAAAGAAEPAKESSDIPDEDTNLHRVVRLGDVHSARRMVGKHAHLVGVANERKETPLHLAARAGDLEMVTLLIDAAKECADDSEQLDPKARRPLRLCNRSGDTPAHLALRNSYESVAMAMVEADSELAKAETVLFRESLLYLAAEREMVVFARWLLQHHPDCSYKGPNGETALHVAAKSWQAKNIKKVFRWKGQAMVDQPDFDGNTPLHHACYRGWSVVAGLHSCFPRNPKLYSHPNGRGNRPIHMAAMGGHDSVVRWLIRAFPPCGNSLNGRSMNILHVAIEYEKREVVAYILKERQLQGLINEHDRDGNSPLHLAVRHRNGDNDILRALLQHPRVDKLARDRSHRTALDVFLEPDERSRGRDSSTEEKKGPWVEAQWMLTKAIPPHQEPEIQEAKLLKQNKEGYKSLKSNLATTLNNTSMLATLIATVTFAAAFTLPGGYTSGGGGGGRGGGGGGEGSEGGGGEPILLGVLAFRAFLISDTAAMCCSLAVLFICVYAAWEDISYVALYSKTIQGLMWSSFVSLIVAFATAVYVTIAPRSPWLAILVCVLCGSVPLMTYFYSYWPRISMALRLLRFLNIIAKERSPPKNEGDGSKYPQKTLRKMT